MITAAKTKKLNEQLESNAFSFIHLCPVIWDKERWSSVKPIQIWDQYTDPKFVNPVTSPYTDYRFHNAQCILPSHVYIKHNELRTR